MEAKKELSALEVKILRALRTGLGTGYVTKGAWTFTQLYLEWLSRQDVQTLECVKKTFDPFFDWLDKVERS